MKLNRVNNVAERSKIKKMARGASLKTFVILTTRNIHYNNLCVWPLVYRPRLGPAIATYIQFSFCFFFSFKEQGRGKLPQKAEVTG